MFGSRGNLSSAHAMPNVPTAIRDGASVRPIDPPQISTRRAVAVAQMVGSVPSRRSWRRSLASTVVTHPVQRNVVAPTTEYARYASVPARRAKLSRPALLGPARAIVASTIGSTQCSVPIRLAVAKNG